MAGAPTVFDTFRRREGVAVRRMESLPKAQSPRRRRTRLRRPPRRAAPGCRRRRQEEGRRRSPRHQHQPVGDPRGRRGQPRGVKGKVVVRALDGGNVLGKVATYKAKRARAGKPKSARRRSQRQRPTQRPGQAGPGGLRGRHAQRPDALAQEERQEVQAHHHDRARPRPRQVQRPLQNPVAKPYKGDPIATANSDRCDFLDPAVCRHPWPNNYFTVADPSSDTGRRLDFDHLDARQQDRPAVRSGRLPARQRLQPGQHDRRQGA